MGQKQIAVMKIERRITANRFETNSRARKLRNSSSVKLATFPSLFSFSFLLSLSLSPSLSLFPLSLFSPFISVRCPFPGTHTPTSPLSLSRDCPSPFSSFFSLVRQFRYSSPPIRSSAESTVDLVDALFSCKRESASSRICALPLPTLVRKHTGRKC